MQTRYFNWLAPDKSDWVNRQHFALQPYGLYRGFDVKDASSTGSTLVLGHTATAFSEVMVDGTLTTGKAVWISRQAVVIIEDTAISIPVTINTGGNPRIDLIVGEHVYVQSDGGALAGYTTIVGTPSATPVAPALTDANKQVILGRLYWPASSTSVVDAVYTREPSPNFNADTNIVHTTGDQDIAGRKKFDFISSVSDVMTYESGTLSLQAVSNRNLYRLAKIDDTFKQVERINIPDDFTTSNFFEVTTLQNLTLKAGVGIALESGVAQVHINAGETFKVVNFASLVGYSIPANDTANRATYFIFKGGEVRRDKYSKMYAMLAENKGTATIDGDGKITLDGKGNFYDITIPMATYGPILAIRVLSDIKHDTAGNFNSGAVITLRFIDSAGIDTNYASISAAGPPIGGPVYKGISLNTRDDIAEGMVKVYHEGYIKLMEVGLRWVIVQHRDRFINMDIMRQDYEALNQVYEHHWTKLQSWNWVQYGIGISLIVGNKLRLNNTGNHFYCPVLPDDMMNDIYIEGVAARSGTLITVTFIHSVWIPGYSTPMSIRTIGATNIRTSDRYGGLTIEGAGATEVVTFRKTDTVWDIVSSTGSTRELRDGLSDAISGFPWDIVATNTDNYADVAPYNFKVRKLPGGNVQIVGRIKYISTVGASVNLMGTLPAGYHPDHRHYLKVIRFLDDGSMTNDLLNMEIQEDGTIRFKADLIDTFPTDEFYFNHIFPLTIDE